MPKVKRAVGPTNFAQTFAFTDKSRLIYGWDKWISRSHPRNADDVDNRLLRKTCERLEKQSRDSSAKHSAKSTILPWKELNGIWLKDKDAVERIRTPAPLHDISHKPVQNGARKPRATQLRELAWMFRQQFHHGIPDGDEQAWLTARMAARLHVVATELAEMCEGDLAHVLSGRLPHFARPYLEEREHPGWRAKFARCFRHVSEELAQGQPPNPDSTGEMMAMYITIAVAEEYHSYGYFESQGIDVEVPAHPFDSDWDQARESGLDCREIRVLLELGIADPQMIGIILPESSHLHPSQWFRSRKPLDDAEDYQQPLTVARTMPRGPKFAPPTYKLFSVDLRSPSAGVLVVPDRRSARKVEKQKEKVAFAALPGKLTYQRRKAELKKKPLEGRS